MRTDPERLTPRRRVAKYVETRASSVWRYVWNGLVLALFAWMPSLVGIAVRAVAYRLILRRVRGFPGIERGVRLRRPEDIMLGAGVFIDTGASLDGGPGGLGIGDGTLIMSGCTLQVYNHRGLPHAGIRIGRRTYLGEHTLLRGQGGIDIGDDVLFGPGVQVLAVNHVAVDPSRPIRAQGITAEGIRIEDDCWIGAGALILDGVTIGRRARIGAGAVVTHSIPSGALAVGVPARVVRDLHDVNANGVLPFEVHLGGLSDL